MQTKPNEKTAQLPQTLEPRNAGMELDLDWVARVQANTSAIERRAGNLGARRSVKKQHQAARRSCKAANVGAPSTGP